MNKKKDETIELQEQENELDYLISASDEIPYELETTGQAFVKVSLGGSTDRIDEATGIEISGKKFNAANWPNFNYDTLYAIPLLIQPNRRVLYAAEYSSQSRPPDCWSPNGVTAANPGVSVLGKVLEYCATCSFGVYGSKPACKPRPAVYVLTLFYVNGELKAFPNLLDVATGSRHTVMDINSAIAKPTTLNGTLTTLAPFTRVIKVSRQFKTVNGNNITGWTMRLLTQNDSEVDSDGNKMPNFAPKQFISPDLLKAAEMANNALIRPVTLLEGKSTPQLAGDVQSVTFSGSVDMAVGQEQLTVTADTF